jgi:type I restriction enzyme S subunit
MFYGQANSVCEGSGKRYVISLSKFKKLKVYYPKNISEQQAIATILSDMDKEISDLESKCDKYRLIKQGMMQKLLTGQIRLK